MVRLMTFKEQEVDVVLLVVNILTEIYAQCQILPANTWSCNGELNLCSIISNVVINDLGKEVNKKFNDKTAVKIR